MIYISPDSGATWMMTGTPASSEGLVASSADGTKLVAPGDAGVCYTSRDSGATWTQVNLPSGELLTVASSADGNKLVAVGWSSTDGVSGGHIYTLQFPLPPPAPLPSPNLSISGLGQSVGLSWLVPSTAYVLQQNLSLNTTNWTDVTTPPTLNFTNLNYQVTVSPALGSRFYRLRQR
jgi:hypothetical protein